MNSDDLRKLMQQKMSTSPSLRSLMKRIRSDKATFRDTAEYSRIYSELLGKCLSDNVLSLDDREAAAADMLRDSYDHTNSVLSQVQTGIDKKNSINLRPRAAAFPLERVTQFSHSLVDPTVEDSVIKRRARSGTANISMSHHDEYMKTNAEFRSKAGLKCYITRETDGKCCKWCTAIAGRYVYGEEPHDVYRRHDNCGCSVIYENGRQRQDVWSKRTWEKPKVGTGASPPTKFTPEQARTIEQEKLSQFRGFGSYHQIKSSAEIIFDRIDGSKPITPAFAEEYRKEYDSFTAIFGEMLSLRGVNIAPYQGYNVYGGYNPQSREITLIGVGGKQGKANMQAIASKNKKDGQWSTNSVYHTFRHELGHSLQKELELNDRDWALKRSKIEEIKRSLEKELTNLSESDKMIFKKSKLSKYGFESVDEFISESVAEYMNNPDKARKTAKSVVEILLGKE